ncbi:MAG: Na+/H+ antiporter [Alphaproteobacteria bacterium]|nr:Na+/H+ antiporter [Alphaproteobacteria bacterium]
MGLILGLVLCGLAVGLAARRLQIPYPIALVIGGLLIGSTPGLPVVAINPELLLTVVLPPILYHAALFTSWRDFRRNLQGIATLAVGLVLATAVAVAATAKLVAPEMSWAAALLLGAIVSPPDAVAATAVMRRVKVRKKVATVIEGESLVNDAAALVLYKFAVLAVVAGGVSLQEAGLAFLTGGPIGIAVGLAIGWAATRVQRYLGDSTAEIAVSLSVPYAAYLMAESVDGSAVLATVAAGLIRGWQGPETFTAYTRIQAFAVWDVLVFVINTVVFVLLGVHLAPVLHRLSDASWSILLLQAAAIALSAIAIRAVWVFAGGALNIWWARRAGIACPYRSWRDLAVVAWSGMRGIVSLVAALALPFATADGMAFAARDQVIFFSYGVIFVTLVLQGLTLGPLMRLLKVGRDDGQDKEEQIARAKSAYAAADEMKRHFEAGKLTQDMTARLQHDLRWIGNDWDVEPVAERGLVPEGDEQLYRGFYMTALGAARRRLIKLHRDEVIGDDVLHRIERELDVEELRLCLRRDDLSRAPATLVRG